MCVQFKKLKKLRIDTLPIKNFFPIQEFEIPVKLDNPSLPKILKKKEKSKKIKSLTS